MDAWAVDQAWRRGLADLSANRRLFALVASPLVAVAVVSALVLPRTFLNGAFVGLVAAIAVAYPVWTATTIVGARRLAATGRVEAFSAAELARLDRRRWIVLDDRDLPGVDADHVVLGGGPVLVVASAWRREPVRFADLSALVDRAATAAVTLTSRLDDAGVRRQVVPALVVWGPGAVAFAGTGTVQRGVRVLAGPELVDWCASHAEGTLDLAAFGALRDG